MSSDALKKAIDSLKVTDIYLRELHTVFADDFNPKYSPTEALQIQDMHQVLESRIIAGPESQKSLQVYIQLGMRWLDETIPDEEKKVRAVSEAVFVAEYLITSELEQISIDEFSLKNASFHVWPYWRELLASQCQRTLLPKVMLPTLQLARNRDQASAAATSL